jgi:hypothetical protein
MNLLTVEISDTFCRRKRVFKKQLIFFTERFSFLYWHQLQPHVQNTASFKSNLLSTAQRHVFLSVESTPAAMSKKIVMSV